MWLLSTSHEGLTQCKCRSCTWRISKHITDFYPKGKHPVRPQLLPHGSKVKIFNLHNCFQLWFMGVFVNQYRQFLWKKQQTFHSGSPILSYTKAVLYFWHSQDVEESKEYMRISPPQSATASIKRSNSNLWHRGLGHNYSVLFEESAVQRKSPPTCFPCLGYV